MQQAYKMRNFVRALSCKPFILYFTFFFVIFHYFSLELYFQMSTSVQQKRKGRNFSDIWDTHMIKGEQRSRGHYSAICNYCKNSWKEGRPRILREHLANHCKRCPREVSSYYAKVVGKKKAEEDESEEDEEEIDLPNKRRKQTSISHYYKYQKLEEGRADEIDKSITTAFIMANIPFNVIENPWFIDLVKTLEPGYNVPSRQILGGSLLEAELSRVGMRINRELERESDFTIGKSFSFFVLIIIHIIYFHLFSALDGWTDPQGNSLWSFILITPSRKEYLLRLEDLSRNRHTSSYLANVIEEVINQIGIEKIIAIVSDNASNVAGARRIITKNHPRILNV